MSYESVEAPWRMLKAMAKPQGSNKKAKEERAIISLAEAEEALGRSGYLLEGRIDTVLRSKDYGTTPNSTFPDPKTGESRELDILAGHWSFEDRENARRAINHVLVIECVNNPQPIAFLARQGGASGLASILKIYPVWRNTIRQDPETGEVTGGGMVMTEVLEIAKYHHYADGRVATQYCTFQRKKGEDRQWMALHSDQDHATFRKICDAVDYYSPSFDLSTRSVLIVYPILVVQGQLLEVQQDGGQVKVRKVDRIAYTHSIYRAQTQGVKQVRYRIDVVTESFFPKLLALIEKSRKEVLRRLWELPELDSTDSTVEIAVDTPERLTSL